MGNRQESPDQVPDLPSVPTDGRSHPPLGPVGSVPDNEKKNIRMEGAQ